MATNINVSDRGPATYKVVASAERNAKPVTTDEHTHRTTSHDVVATTNKHPKTSHWPIVDLMNSQPYSYLHRAGSGPTATIDTTCSKSSSHAEDIDLSADPGAGKRIDLYLSNMPQGLVAKPGNNHKDMGPMERFVAETHGLYKRKSATKKPLL
ncbi:uncharacterized protein HMPREF1541_05678 [Cyphellophora europaea CBS 101466]|uniref:Uncharacterized protein n=1 Tax=Cyphellophora europaea (strain CBS 101466) TaxID=1220924 RepID=W2RT21_CYPE1|nr:uncharacterized protein HMPREF1541_05678 [Cyphellophora europaea CBS 101466]ETN39455.1 hypothetical protein HMPREF1541_05678 [Cyphellophora europaea CBS 101466]